MATKLTQDQFNDIVSIFENAGFETRSYSGRGMYGKECLGITCPNPMKVLMETIAYFADQAEEEDGVSTFIEQLGTPETDSMGLNAILYFPSVDWQDFEDEGEEA